MCTIMRKFLWQCATVICFYWSVGTAHSVEYGFDIAIDSEYSDNAFRDNDRKEGERQDRIGVSFGLTEQGEGILADLNYIYNKQFYEKDSQLERGLLEGDARLRLGQESGLFVLNMEHSNRVTLIDNRQSDTTQNLDERSIYSLKPETNFKLSSADRVSIIGTLEKIEYSEQSSRTSERRGADMQWSHRLSALSEIGVSGNYRQIDYTEVDGSSNELSSVYITISRALRNASYDAKLGYNLSERDGEQFDSFSYYATFALSGLEYNLVIELSDYITDTSAGNSTSEVVLSSDVQNITGSFNGVDQYKTRSSELIYNYLGLCLKCNVNITIGTTKDEYLQNKLENVINKYGSMTLSYNLNQESSVRLAGSIREMDFINSEQTTDYSVVDFRYVHQRVSGVRFAVIGSHSSRKDDSGLSAFDENKYGISLGYSF